MAPVIPGFNAPAFPGPDSDFLAFCQNVAGEYDPLHFGITYPLPADLTAAVNDFEGSVTSATNPSTRTSVAIATKNNSRVALTGLVASIYRAAINGYRSGVVSGALLTTYGFRLPDQTPSVIPAPEFAPVLGVVASRLDYVDLRLTHVTAEGAVSTRKFPYGMAAVQIFSSSNGSDWTFRQQVRRVNIALDVSAIANGSNMMFKARYITARGLVGPFSDSVSGVVMSNG